jgi:hypothetical protein
MVTDRYRPPPSSALSFRGRTGVDTSAVRRPNDAVREHGTYKGTKAKPSRCGPGGFAVCAIGQARKRRSGMPYGNPQNVEILPRDLRKGLSRLLSPDHTTPTTARHVWGKGKAAAVTPSAVLLSARRPTSVLGELLDVG